MTKQTVIFHPHIKATLKNLDLDLDSELNQYQQYLNSLEAKSVTSPQQAIPALESQINLTKYRDDSWPKTLPTLVDESAIIKTEKEQTEIIPFDSRIVTQEKSLLDIVLTPWGIFGLIFFFTANGLIFLYRDFNPQQANLTSKNNTQLGNSNLDLNQPQINQLETTDNNQSNQELNQASLSPSLPSPLPTTKSTKVTKTNQNQPINLYPDLKTALLTEAKNYQPKLPPPVYPTTNLSSSPVVMNQNSVTLPPSLNKTTSVSKTSPKPQPQTQYYVVTDYQNMENYSQVKEIISEAFISKIEDKMKIQLGVFDDQSDAEKYNQQMKNQGLESKIISVTK